MRDRETKQVEFLRASGVQSKRFYIYDGMRLDRNYGGYNELRNVQQNPNVWVMREFANTDANHLRMPLPKGRVRFYRRDQDGQVGVIQGDDSDIGFTQTTVTVMTVGTGTGTHMGRFSFTQTVIVDLTKGTESGSGEWIAANGDSMSVAITGSGEPVVTPDGVVIKITETFTITGGTGRFADTTGSFTMERVASPVTFMTSGSYEGAISSPGADH